MKKKDNVVQVKNSKTHMFVKVNRSTHKILSQSKERFKDVPLVAKKSKKRAVKSAPKKGKVKRASIKKAVKSVKKKKK